MIETTHTHPPTPYSYGTPTAAMQASDKLPLIEHDDGGALKHHTFTIFLALSACFGSFLFGYHVAFSSPSSTGVKRDGGLSQHETDLMWSMLPVGGCGGALIAGRLAEVWGRRMTVLVNALPFIGGALIMVTWVTYPGLLIGRLICGVGVGWSSVIVPLYIAEISPTSLRGTLGACNQLFITLGVLFVNVIGLPTVTHPHFWKLMMLLSLVFVGMFFVPLLMFGPESPRYLVDCNDIDGARNALTRLRGRYLDVDGELESLLEESKNDGNGGGGGGGDAKRSSLASLSDGRNLRPLRIGIAVVMLQQWSGINAFIFNTKSLFQGSDTSSESADRKALYGAITVGAVQVLFTTVSAGLMDIKGRRFFMLLSSAGMAVSCLVMGIVYRANAATELKILIVICYIIAFSMGLGPVPWLYCSEIFPSEARGLMVSICTVVNWFSAFLITASYDSMQNALGKDVTFWSYGGVCAVGCVFVYLFVPETKGKTLEEVQRLFDIKKPDRLLDSAA